MNKRLKKLAIGIALTVFAVFIFIKFCYINHRMISIFDDDRTTLVIEDNIDDSEARPLIDENEILLSYDTIKKYIDDNIWWDSELQKVTITTEDKIVRMQTDNLEAYVNNKPVTLNMPVKNVNGVIYVPILFLADFYNINIQHNKDDNVVIIDFKDKKVQTAKAVSKKAVVRTGKSVRYPIVEKLGKDTEDNTLLVYEKGEKWYKVRTARGAVGYIQKKYVKLDEESTTAEETKKDIKSSWKPQSGKINLVWDIYESRPDKIKADTMPGIDVVSPTWFELQKEPGKPIINRADSRYVEWAHNNGYKVWALFRNDFNSSANTSKFLNNTDYRDAVIRELLTYASLYNLDGINIDFENIKVSDKDALTQFVRELTPLLKEQGLVVSIDIGVPDGSENWSLCYDRKGLSEVVDYIIVMTYDQHWASSPTAGSTAQLSWVETYLQKTLEEVPKEKLLMGIPFYTRLWKEEKDEEGQVKVSSVAALSMDNAKKTVKNNNAQIEWDEESGQFYAEYTKEGATYKIWLEDENSIDLKSSLALKYDIAGTAIWARSFASKSIWSILDKNIKNTDSYKSWQENNQGKEREYNMD